MTKKKISIITPVFNESESIDAYYQRMSTVLDGLSDNYDFEIIITDNRSQDDTFQKATELAARDNRIRVLRFSRNFGYQLSILTGYKHATGDAAIEFDCDLQDPPELLPEFIAAWEKGFKVVYGIRKTRQEPFLLSATRNAYYRLLRMAADHDIPVDAGDFILVDRKVLNVLKQIDNPDVYIRGVIFSLGLNRIGIPYHRASRLHGDSKFSFGKLLQLAKDGMFSQSSFPLQLSGLTALFLAVAALLIIPLYTVGRLVAGADWPPGFATLVTLMLAMTAMNAFFFSILGSYIARLYRMTQKQEHVLIDEDISFQEDGD